MVRAVFIDIDNTLLSFHGYVLEALQEGLPMFGISEYRQGMDETFHRVNDELWRSLERGEINYEELYAQRFDRIFEAMGVTGNGKEFEQYFKRKLRDSAVLMDGAADLVAYLASKYILCAASNGPFDQQRNRLSVCGLLPLFRHLFISEDLGASKPHQLFYERAFERLNAAEGIILPEECVMIGDSLTSDMAGGIAYGLKTVFYDLSGTGDTKGRPVDHIVYRLSDIYEIL